MPTAAELLARKCHHQENALSDQQIADYLPAVDGWAIQDGKLCKTFGFKNYFRTMAFVNAAAWIFHVEDHHPELLITYNRCTARFDTHSVNEGRGGISENDFICAAKVDAVYSQSLA